MVSTPTPAASGAASQQNPTANRGNGRRRGPRRRRTAEGDDRNPAVGGVPLPRGNGVATNLPNMAPSAISAAPFVPSMSQQPPPSQGDATSLPSGTQARPRRGQMGNSSRTTQVVVNRTFGSQLTAPQSSQPGTESQGANPRTRQPKGQRNQSNPVPASAPRQEHTGIPSIDAAQVQKNSRRNRQRWKTRGNETAASQAALDNLSAFPVADLSKRIHTEIECGEYECPICTIEVDRKSAVWYCRTCWVVFHFPCLKVWADGQFSAIPTNGDDQSWRCPGCNLPQSILPAYPTCWCTKEINPKSITGLPPLSCGQTCSRSRSGCPHPCSSVCHAGPCPPCQLILPPKECFCGKETARKKCAESNSESGWGCGSVCGKELACGDHQCQDICHDGPCSPCSETVPATCYCGTKSSDVLCSSRGKVKKSEINGPNGPKTWFGTFSCDTPCSRDLDCGNHNCSKVCHPQDLKPGHCPLSPNSISHCPCGKTRLQAMSVFRSSCSDPIPACKEKCSKVLRCGHVCAQVCHGGDCGSCKEIVTIECQCGRTQSNSACPQGSDIVQPMCPKTCYTTMSCGKHTCMERCCFGQKKGLDRLKRTKRGRLDSVGVAIEHEHVCTNVCNSKLPCGTHNCIALCHKGRCPPCPEAIFDDIACNCGETVIFAPLPCGTKPPACKYPCERSRSCGHAKVAHNCHLDDEECPKCPYLTTKTCLCQRNQLKNQPCWVTEARCTETCGKLLKCGVHRCSLGCHAPGQCGGNKGGCSQPCGKAKSCGHTDNSPCHGTSSCAETGPCQHKIIIFCICQRTKQEVKCLGSKTGKGNVGKTLPCDGECARVQRNRSLASALNIKDEWDSEFISYSAITLAFYTKAPVWCDAQEEILQKLADDPDGKQTRFPPMPTPKREFIHSLSNDYGLDSQSLDPEPHRHVVVFKTPKFVPHPRRSLAESVKLRNTQKLQARQGVLKLRAGESGKPSVLFNAYSLSNVKFGLTVEDLWISLKTLLHTYPDYQLEIEFIASGDVILAPASANTDAFNPTAEEVHNLVTDLRDDFARNVQQNQFGSVRLCAVDLKTWEITEYEPDIPVVVVAPPVIQNKASTFNDSDGWSTIITKSAVGGRPSGKADASSRFPHMVSARPSNQFGTLGASWAESMSPVKSSWNSPQSGSSSGAAWNQDFGASSSNATGGTAQWTTLRSTINQTAQANSSTSVTAPKMKETVVPTASVSNGQYGNDDDVLDDWEDEADQLVQEHQYHDRNAADVGNGGSPTDLNGSPTSVAFSDSLIREGRAADRKRFALESTPTPSPSPSPSRDPSPIADRVSSAQVSKSSCTPS